MNTKFDEYCKSYDRSHTVDIYLLELLLLQYVNNVKLHKMNYVIRGSTI